DPIGLQVPEIRGEGFAGNQVDGYGIAGERIHYQHVELLARFGIQHQTSISQSDLDLSRSVLEIREVAAGDFHHLRIDLVDAERVAATSVGCQRTAAQTKNADPPRLAFLRRHSPSDTGGRAEIRDWFSPMLLPQELLTVIDRAVNEPAAGVFVEARIPV